MSRVPSVVLDTMILAQATTSPNGPAAQLVRAGERGVFRPVTSWHQLLEYGRTMDKPWAQARGVTAADARAFTEAYARTARVALDRPTRSPLTTDPGDNYIVRLAQTTGAVVVTRDDGILNNHPEHVPVFTPGEFAETLAVWEVDGATYRLGVDSSGALAMGV